MNGGKAGTAHNPKTKISINHERQPSRTNQRPRRHIYADNVAKGFWPKNAKDRNVGEALMLAVSELSEGIEAHRQGLNDDHLPHRKGLEVEIADCIIRLLDLSGGLGLDVGGALVEKLAYNRNRPHKHGKNY